MHRCLDSRERAMQQLFSTCVMSTELLEPAVTLLKLVSEGESAGIVARLIGWPAAEDATHPFTTLVSTLHTSVSHTHECVKY
jgi:hypothetical protein